MMLIIAVIISTTLNSITIIYKYTHRSVYIDIYGEPERDRERQRQRRRFLVPQLLAKICRLKRADLARVASLSLQQTCYEAIHLSLAHVQRTQDSGYGAANDVFVLRFSS